MNLSFTAQFDWISIEADGSVCYNCGDQCFLKMFKLVVTIKEIKSRINLNLVSCESCL